MNNSQSENKFKKFQEENKKKLISYIREKNVVLITGSGCSKFVGYPTGKELIQNMLHSLVPELEIDDCLEYPFLASKIKKELERRNSQDDYFNFLRKTFSPHDNRRNFEDFLLELVKLEFCGYVTTNYDMVLEYSIHEAFGGKLTHLPESIDACNDQHRNPIIIFLRGLPSKNTPRSVLHLHGLYSDPEYLILTPEDFEEKYGKLKKKGNSLTEFTPSLHYNLLNNICTSYYLFFVGFSFNDIFLINILNFIQQFYKQGSACNHFATYPFTLRDEIPHRVEMLRKYGVAPIFYYVPPQEKGNNSENHDNLRKLIFEIAGELKRLSQKTNIYNLTVKTLGL